MTDRPLDAPKITEREWQVTVETMARWCGWRVYHTYDSRRSNAGFPDLVLVHPDGRLIFAELKTDTGKITKAQQGWLEALETAVKPSVAVWRPRDLETAKAALQRPGRLHELGERPEHLITRGTTIGGLEI